MVMMKFGSEEFWNAILFGSLFLLLVGWAGTTIVSNVACKSNKSLCTDYLRCSHYGENCDPTWTDAINFYLSKKETEKKNLEKIQYIQTLKDE